jgi:hypothetical protein
MLKAIDMFPRTVVFQKWSKKPLTYSHVQMVSKVARRHQFHQLDPRGDGSIDVKAVSLNFTGFSELHLSCLLNLKG